MAHTRRERPRAETSRPQARVPRPAIFVVRFVEVNVEIDPFPLRGNVKLLVPANVVGVAFHVHGNSALPEYGGRFGMGATSCSAQMLLIVGLV